jgi:hypothetical protein
MQERTIDKKIDVLEASVSHRRAEASCKDLARVGELGMENWSGVAHPLSSDGDQD